MKVPYFDLTAQYAELREEISAALDRVCRKGDGLFPGPQQIDLSCSCPDGAYMCKHVAATLYGVGARLDSQPELLFTLRGVDQQELIANAAVASTAGKMKTKSKKVLANSDLASVFGLDMSDQPGDPGVVDLPVVTRRKAKPARAAATANAKVPAPPVRAARTARTAVARAGAKKRPTRSKTQPKGPARRRNHGVTSAT